VTKVQKNFYFFMGAPFFFFNARICSPITHVPSIQTTTHHGVFSSEAATSSTFPQNGMTAGHVGTWTPTYSKSNAAPPIVTGEFSPDLSSLHGAYPCTVTVCFGNDPTRNYIPTPLHGFFRCGHIRRCPGDMAFP